VAINWSADFLVREAHVDWKVHPPLRLAICRLLVQQGFNFMRLKKTPDGF
jgi:hypothetical protein